jgi:hypothetical protein
MVSLGTVAGRENKSQACKEGFFDSEDSKNAGIIKT